jgi:hypothetical protein
MVQVIERLPSKPSKLGAMSLSLLYPNKTKTKTQNQNKQKTPTKSASFFSNMSKSNILSGTCNPNSGGRGRSRKITVPGQSREI